MYWKSSVLLRYMTCSQLTSFIFYSRESLSLLALYYGVLQRFHVAYNEGSYGTVFKNVTLCEMFCIVHIALCILYYPRYSLLKKI